jgi:hypothetical protein
MKKTDTVNCLYLFEDRHAVVVYSTNHPKVGRSEYVEIHECLPDPNAVMQFTGRIVFSGSISAAGFLAVLKGARQVRATVPSIKNGSMGTERINQPVGSLTITLPQPWADLYFYDMPGLISGGYVYNEDQMSYNETFNPDIREWGGKNVAKIYRIKEKRITV